MSNMNQRVLKLRSIIIIFYSSFSGNCRCNQDYFMLLGKERRLKECKERRVSAISALSCCATIQKQQLV
jgi:hypothetical protein